jgi:hypothetical protein
MPVRHLRSSAAALGWWLVLASASAAAPQDEAIARYRLYVAAVRDGQFDKAVNVVEPVPEPFKPLVVASIKSRIAVEALKKEVVGRWGPPRGDEEDDINGELSDALLNKIEGAVLDADRVALSVKEPTVGAGWMVRRKGEWYVAAGVLLDLMPGRS